MGKLKTLSFILLINLISVTTVNAADIFIDIGSHPSMTLADKWNQRIIIRGEIVRGDYEKLINVVKKDGNIPENIFLNSRGGDVIEAMKIGRFARKALLVTGDIRRKEDYQSGVYCHSACMFIYLACAGKKPDFDVSYGIHRPHFDKSYFSGLSAREAELKYKDMENSVRKYLEEMNVPQLFIDRIFSIPSDRLEVLDVEQLFAISGDSPAYGEWILAKCDNLSDAEWYDYRNILNAENSNSKHTYSSGYVKYLKGKRSNYFGCRKRSSDEVRKEVFRSLK
jgi:hypothetical protein